MSTAPVDWNSLPHELQTYIVAQLDEQTVVRHRAALRRLSTAFARTLYNGDWRTSTSAFVTVKGILEYLVAAARAHAKLHTEPYALIHTRLLDVFTRKEPRNMAKDAYDHLQAQVPLFFEDLDDVAQKLFAQYVSHCFKYLDRFYVKRTGVWTVEHLCERAIGTTKP